MKLSKLLRVIGGGAVIAAQFTPAGAAVTKGLDVAGKALHQADGVEDGEPTTLREIAIQTVLANAGPIIATALATGRGEIAIRVALGEASNAVEKWLQIEQQLAADGDGTDGR